MKEEKVLTVEDLTPPEGCKYHKEVGCGMAREGKCDKPVQNLCLIYAEWFRRNMLKS